MKDIEKDNGSVHISGNKKHLPVKRKNIKKIMWCDDDTIKPYFTEAGRNITYGNLKRQLQSPCFCGFAEKIKKSQKKLKKVLDIYAIIVL